MRPSRFAHSSDDSPEAAPNGTLFIILVLNNKVILDNANKLLQSIEAQEKAMNDYIAGL